MGRYGKGSMKRLDDLRGSERRRAFMPRCPKCGKGGYAVRTAVKLPPKPKHFTIPNIRYCPECKIVYKASDNEEKGSPETPYIEV